MKLSQLFEEQKDIDVHDKRQEWIWDAFPEDINDYLNDGDWCIEDGKICYDPDVQSSNPQRTTMKMKWDGEIPYPMGVFNGALYCVGKLTTLKNLPTKVLRALVVANNAIEKLDYPIDCNLLRLNGNKIKSVKDIHKMVKCKIIMIDDNPIEGSILDILKIPELKVIDYFVDKGDLSKAMKIISKFAGKGSSGIVKAQRELIENDLEDYT